MVKRMLVVLLALICIASSAAANDYIYIANPDPTQRLHLRTAPSADSESLGKYYNGAPIERIGDDGTGWVRVRVGIGAVTQTGYMKKSFLSNHKQANAMPQYVSTEKMLGYTKPDQRSAKVTIPAGRAISFMGLLEGDTDWWHVMVYTNSSEGPYCCFLPENTMTVQALAPNHGVNVYISNPDPADRLHLRAEPDATAQSLGKYYNGCIGNMIGFSEDGEWIHVELYGQTGWMMSRYLTIEGIANYTMYGIPVVKTTRNTPIYEEIPAGNNYEATISQGTELEVLGINRDVLHVRYDGRTWFVMAEDTTFSE